VIFDDYIQKDASVVADGWSGYCPMKKYFPKLEQRLSNKVQNFTMLHIQIRNFKNWFRRVYTKYEYKTRNISADTWKNISTDSTD